ncbi:hypothetical protein CEP53_015263 [Fusarium sp. AF-6]|nr:hypothetical protein CEP53_015263 [Fusarium sp. AF-6]
MSERVSREDVDQRINGPGFNPNTLVGNPDPAAMDFNGMPLQNMQNVMNNHLGLGALNMPILPGQSVDQAYQNQLASFIQKPVATDKAADKAQDQAQKVNDVATAGFPMKQFPVNNGYLPQNGFLPQNGYLPQNGFLPPNGYLPQNPYVFNNGFGMPNSFAFNNQFNATNLFAANKEDATKNDAVMSAKEFGTLSDDEFKAMMHSLDAVKADSSKDNAEKTSAAPGVVDPTLALGNAAAGNNASFNLGNLATGLPTPQKSSFVNFVPSAPQAQVQQQPVPDATPSKPQTPTSSIDPALLAQSVQPEQRFNEKGDPIVAYTAAQLEQLRQLKQKQQAGQPQKSLAPQPAINPRQLPAQPVRRVGQNFPVPQQNIVSPEQAAQLNKQQQIPQQNQQAPQPVAQVNRQQAQPVTQRAPVQVQQPAAVQQFVPVQKPASVQQIASVPQQPALTQKQSAPGLAQQKPLCFPQVSAYPTKKTPKKEKQKDIFHHVGHEQASRAQPAPRGRPCTRYVTDDEDTMPAKSTVFSTASAQETPNMEFIEELGHTATKTPKKSTPSKPRARKPAAPKAPKAPKAPRKPAAPKKPAASKAQVPAQAPTPAHPANFNKPTPVDDASVTEYASTSDDSSLFDGASAIADSSDLDDASDLEEISASEFATKPARVITRTPSDVVVSKKKRGKQSAATVEGDDSSQRQSSQNGDLNRKSSGHENPASDNNNIDPQLKPVDTKVASDPLGRLVLQIAQQSFLAGAKEACNKIVQKSTKHFEELGTFCGFQVQLPEGVNFDDAIAACHTTMDVMADVQQNADTATTLIFCQNNASYKQLVPTATKATNHSTFPPASITIVNKENDTATVSKETQPQISQQPQTNTTSDNASSEKVTTNNKRKSDAEDRIQNKKARTDKSDVPTVQPSIQLILPNPPLITSQPQSVEVAESTQVAQTVADATAEATAEVSDTVMADAPSKPSHNVDYSFDMPMSFDFETASDDTNTAEPEAVAESEIVAQPEAVTQPETALWPEFDPRDLLNTNLLMGTSPGPFNAYLTHAPEAENPLASQSVEHGLLFLQQTMNQEENTQQDENTQHDEALANSFKPMIPGQEDDLFGDDAMPQMSQEEYFNDFDFLNPSLWS